jgi:hypothetical protein
MEKLEPDSDLSALIHIGSESATGRALGTPRIATSQISPRTPLSTEQAALPLYSPMILKTKFKTLKLSRLFTPSLVF